MDYKDYLQKKEKGLTEIILAGTNGFAYRTQKFDVETGEPIPPEIESLDKSRLLAERDNLVYYIYSIDTILAEIEALENSIAKSQRF